MAASAIYTKTFAVPQTSIDENGHVNNVAYVQWMQDIAVEHYSSIGGISAQGPYSTWVENIRRARSLRKYEFSRKSDGEVLARGETDWVVVDANTGSPRAIAEEVKQVLK